MDRATDNQGATLLLSAEEAARLLGIARSHLYQLHSSGRLGPLPVKLGKRSLWNRKELEAWTDAGCPVREKWLLVKVESRIPA